MPALDKITEWLKTLDEESICELLSISSEDLIARFMDIIEERRNVLETEYEDFEEGYNEESEDEGKEYSDGFRIIKPFEDSEEE